MSLAVRLTLWCLGWELQRFMWNRFPEKAESGSTHNRTSRFLFYFFFIGFVWFLLVPVGKLTGRFVTSMQFPRSWICFAASTLGRCSLAGGFGWDSVWWETNVAGSWHRGESWAGLLQTFPGRGRSAASLQTMISQ